MKFKGELPFTISTDLRNVAHRSSDAAFNTIVALLSKAFVLFMIGNDLKWNVYVKEVQNPF